ncbi:competence type IV pilus major pilin ComGC [Anaerorhabdus furcosa]|uniref:Competence protein ComGC n=1 Tax=Anaerorhabdus furcosa TaxID=118967 RepID=A0A1T4P9C4_9FIRM|nr:competence type IV pilus major pilin ComGC [Anaerorhabdus furcosa]SJZ87478.1 competence protein ComGC [Anaerorhabdus furcosa]
MKKGFTLLEMIIVVSVLSILFLLAVPNIQKVMKIVDDKGCNAMLKVVDSAILQYRLDYEQYPNDIFDLVNAGLMNEEQIQCSTTQSVGISNGQAVLQ